jgi:carboxylesterase
VRIISKPAPPAGKARRRWLMAIAFPLAFLLLAVATIYLWPLGEDGLRRSSDRTLDFAAATAAAQQHVAQDTADLTVLPKCRTQFLTHGRRTAKAVLMLHGYTGCPGDFAEMATTFFNQGYNVYLAREPRHGRVNEQAHQWVTARELVDYADESATVAAGLGDEFGVIGLSGGGSLATWLAEYRHDVRRVLVLSPFYRPNASQAPPALIKPMVVLWGRRVLPDRKNGDMYYSALAQYLQVVANYRDRPVNDALTGVAVVISRHDDQIDLDEAIAIPERLAQVNDIPLARYEIPDELAIPHDVASPDGLGPRAEDFYARYAALYAGT